MKIMLFVKKPMPHVRGIDCHFGKSTNNKKGSSNHEQLHTQLTNDQAISGAHARAFSLASLGTEPETGAKWINQMVQNKFLKAPDRDSDKIK